MEFFQVGSIYTTNYHNFKRDPSPLLFVFDSDVKYTYGINLNYLNSGDQKRMAEFIMKYSVVLGGLAMTGTLLYNLFLRETPDLVKTAFRNYFTQYLRGFLVSKGLKERSGVTGIPQEVVREFRHPAVVYLNRILKTDAFPEQKVLLEKQKEQVEGSVDQNLLKEGIYSRFL